VERVVLIRVLGGVGTGFDGVSAAVEEAPELLTACIIEKVQWGERLGVKLQIHGVSIQLLSLAVLLQLSDLPLLVR